MPRANSERDPAARRFLEMNFEEPSKQTLGLKYNLWCLFLVVALMLSLSRFDVRL